MWDGQPELSLPCAFKKSGNVLWFLERDEYTAEYTDRQQGPVNESCFSIYFMNTSYSSFELLHHQRAFNAESEKTMVPLNSLPL